MARWQEHNNKSVHSLVKTLFFIGLFSVLGFVIGETVGQHFFHPQSAFGLIDTSAPKPYLDTTPPNYFLKPQVTSNPTLTNSPKVIGIILSNACISAIKTHSNSTCPTYQNIVYADNSSKFLSGKFGFVNGFYERIPNNFKQNFAYYNSINQITILVDPPKDIADKIPIIEIYTTLPTFADKHANDLEAINGTRVLHQYRFVVDCHSLTVITYSKSILDDTISYLLSGCTKTNLVTEITIHPVNKYIDPTQSALWKFQQAMSLEKKKVATSDCRIVKCDISVTGKKW
jgi:hypothetical protein